MKVNAKRSHAKKLADDVISWGSRYQPAAHFVSPKIIITKKIINKMQGRLLSHNDSI